MRIEQIKPNVIVRGPLFPEPRTGHRVDSNRYVHQTRRKRIGHWPGHEPILDAAQIATLEATPETAPFDGDPQRFRLGVEALRLGLAYEYDPYFALSIARVDPLPHQL